MDDFERLRDAVNNDDALAEELFRYQDTVSFTAAVLRLAERLGLVITERTVHDALEAGRAAWYATWAP